MKLKHKLAKKYRSTIYQYESHDPVEHQMMTRIIEDTYVAGFDRAKLHFIDYAKRFLTNPELKPGDHHEEIFKHIGEQEFKDYDGG